MKKTAIEYAEWKAPLQDGGVLIWPSAPELIRHTEENQRSLASADSVRIQGVALPEIRSAQRGWIGHSDHARPIIATGHQTELYHPGVWVKNVVIDALAQKLGGEAMQFAVDTDEPKHLQVRWPGNTLSITDDPAVNTAAWSGLVSGPTPALLQLIEQRSQELTQKWGYASVLSDFLASMRRLSLDGAAGGALPFMLTNAMHELDWELGLRHHALVTSPIWESKPYLVFAHHLLANAPAFAQAYNGSLHQYRESHGIKTVGRPMPDLKFTADECEAPFWTDDLARGSRLRTRVVVRGSQTSLVAGESRFHFDPALDGWTAAENLSTWLRQSQLRLSPRALTLTMYLRLFIVDQFVHGIGGGRYDQVLDRLIEQYFKLAPSYFGVATATLFFPGAVGHERVCLPCVLQQGHRLKHAALGEMKMRMVEKINSLPRCSLDRAMAFQEMQQKLREAAAPAMLKWEQTQRELQKRLAEEETIFDRELFYAVQSRDRLSDLISRCRNEINAAS